MPPLPSNSHSQSHEGLVLRSIDYRDRQKIITLFSPTYGLFSLIVKGIHQKRSHLLTLTSPFTQGHYIFRIGRSELFTYLDGSPLNTHKHLRDNFQYLQLASQLAQLLLKSQLPGKPAPLLYKLTILYLASLPIFLDPRPLACSYTLKLLLHEGQLNPKSRPSFFTKGEWEIAIQLANARKIRKLKEIGVSMQLEEKVAQLFDEMG